MKEKIYDAQTGMESAAQSLDKWSGLPCLEK